MNVVGLLEQLRTDTEKAVEDLILPVSMQKGDTEKKLRTASVFLMRLPDSTAAKKKAPYIIHQLITTKDIQPESKHMDTAANVRSIFCVYCEKEDEGGLLLLNLMERLRIYLLRHVVIGNRYILDVSSGLEMLIYPDDTAPYYVGEMMSTWKTPAITREVPL